MEFKAGTPPVTKSNAQRSAEYRAKNTERVRSMVRTAHRAEDDRAWLARPFVAWDGEGVTRNGGHDYVLLANSDGNRIRTVDGHLGTAAIFRWALASAREGTINVIYGASYDWNCWFADFTESELRFLYDNGTIRWDGWMVTWRRGKSLRLSRDGQSVTFYDVVSFFQTSFVTACDAYLGDRFTDRELIVENKRLRSSFRAADLAVIQRYNDAELVNLVALMTELRIRLHGAGLKPSRWDGPGAVAVSLMQREGVKSAMQSHPASVQDAVRHAYFGGRFEVVQFGHSNRTAYEYDINSAYPYALAQLPNLAFGEWERVPGDAGSHPYSLYHFRYHAPRSAIGRIQPFPRRMKDGMVVYGIDVEGWSWTPEMNTARDYVRMFGGTLDVNETLVFWPVNDRKPFGFIPALFEERRAMKAANNGAHIGVKLGLNSLYGKTAQQVGWSRNPRTGELRIPPYHQLDWAGFVTATCRSMVLRASLPVLDSIIAFETDAMFSTVPLDVPTGSGLGEWEQSTFRDITYLQSGTYFATTDDGRDIARTRGVDKGTMTRESVLRAMRKGDSHMSATLTRFTTAGIALQGRFDHWRKWETMDKNVALYPDGKRIHVGCSQCSSESIYGLHTTVVAPVRGRISLPYPVGWINPDPNMAQLDEMRDAGYDNDYE
jgi:hypothetical protein